MAQTNYQRLMVGSSVTGTNLFAQPIEGGDGRLYGTAAAGGANNGGTLFVLNKDGSDFAVLHHFPSGASASGCLLEGGEGVLYGTTQGAGSNAAGMIFKLNRDGGGFTVLHHFLTNNTDGIHPFAGLIRAQDGLLYGTTFDGGTNAYGTVFKISTNGSGYSVLYHFSGLENGDASNPSGLLCQGSDGMLYGTTQLGGLNDKGTVFRISTNGTGYSVILEFGLSDLAAPFGGVIEGRDGGLYGTTSSGGSGGGGVVFRLSKDGGSFSVVYPFNTGVAGAGIYPFGSLVQDAAGFLCGTTWSGGSNNFGTVFKVNTNGAGHATLHEFADAFLDGSHPFGGLLLASDGGLYGTTYSGGDAEGGIVFRLLTVAPQIVFTGIERGTGGALLQMSGGAAGRAYHLQASTNLADAGAWLTIGTNTAGIDGRFQYLDAGAATRAARFYRTRTP